MISFSNNNIKGVELGIKQKQWLKDIIRRENLVPGNISYLFCSDEYLIEKNQYFLNHDTYTDIITFDERVGNIVAGSIMISVERVQENAELYGKSFEEELLRVVAHGILHICGYKDKSDEEANEMRLKEEQALQLFRTMYNS